MALGTQVHCDREVNALGNRGNLPQTASYFLSYIQAAYEHWTIITGTAQAQSKEKKKKILNGRQKSQFFISPFSRCLKPSPTPFHFPTE